MISSTVTVAILPYLGLFSGFLFAGLLLGNMVLVGTSLVPAFFVVLGLALSQPRIEKASANGRRRRGCLCIVTGAAARA
jgi:hypothetical protein